MEIALNKNNILDRIKEAYELPGNSKLAAFLEVAPNTVTNWYNRQTLDYDKIFTKCEGVNLEWLLFGEGDMYGEQPSQASKEEDANDSSSYKVEYITELKKMIDLQNKMIASLQSFIEDKDDIIEGLKSGEIIYTRQKKRPCEVSMHKAKAIPTQ